MPWHTRWVNPADARKKALAAAAEIKQAPPDLDAMQRSPAGANGTPAAPGVPPSDGPCGSAFRLLAHPEYAKDVLARMQALNLPSRRHSAMGATVEGDAPDEPDELLGPLTADDLDEGP